MTKARDISKLLSTANGKIAGENLDVSFENITDTGTEGTKVASGTTAERGSTVGQIRFNSTTGLAEYYDGSQFKSIDAPPSVASVSPANVGQSTISSNPSLVITGTNFSSTVTVKITGNDGTEYTPVSTTRNSNTQITITLPSTLTNTNEAYDVTVQNISGLNFTLADAFNINATPVFGVASGSLGTLAFDDRASSNLTSITATDDEGTTVTFSITTGSPPAGLTFNSNGTWSGTADSVGTTATSNFTVTATDGGESVTRDYSITVQSEPPAFTHASGSLGSIFDSQRSSYSITNPVATIGGGATITSYAIQSGSLPSGLSINNSGVISGTASAVGSNTTSTFTVRATASTGTTADRQYTILVYAPQTASYGVTGSSQTFDTTSVKSFTAYLWGAGGVGSTGGFVSGSVSVASGTNTLYIAVGGAGSAGNDTNVWKGGKGNRGGNGSYSGGGFTGLFTGSSPSQGNAVLIAGGGGSSGSNNNNGPYNGGSHSTGGNNCCGTGGGGSGSSLQGGTGGGGSQPGGGGGGGYTGGGGGGGACCAGAGGYGGSNYTGGDSGSATTSSTSAQSNNNTGHPLHQSTWGNNSYDGRLLIVY